VPTPKDALIEEWLAYLRRAKRVPDLAGDEPTILFGPRLAAAGLSPREVCAIYAEEVGVRRRPGSAPRTFKNRALVFGQASREAVRESRPEVRSAIGGVTSKRNDKPYIVAIDKRH
jgi:hypothetical protein